MKCPRCQQESPVDANFCPECGAKLALRLRELWHTNAPTHKFCKKCGEAGDAAAGRQRASLTGVLHPQAPRREDPHVQGRA